MLVTIEELKSRFKTFYTEVDEVVGKYSCTRCGACCRYFSVPCSVAEVTNVLHSVDVKRFVKELPKDPVSLMYECPFLLDDFSCGIYETRPLTCRTWNALEDDCRALLEARDLREKALFNGERVTVKNPTPDFDLYSFLATCSQELAKKTLEMGNLEIDDPLFRSLKEYGNHVVGNAVYAGIGLDHLLPDYEGVYENLKKYREKVLHN